MRHYEVTFIVDPTLSSDEVKATAQKHEDALTGFGSTIVSVDEAGLRPLAYQINRKNSGFYFTIEFGTDKPDFLNKFELALKRDERLLRFLTIKLDKHGVKYNDDKRNGRIGKRKAAEEAAAAEIAAEVKAEA